MKHDLKNVEETTNISIHTNKRSLPLDVDVEKRKADMQKKTKQSEQDKLINKGPNMSNLQAKPTSQALSFITTPYGFIGKRITPLGTPNSNVLDKGSITKQDLHISNITKMKSEDKADALFEVTKSFVNIEVVPLVVKKVSEAKEHIPVPGTSGSKNVKTFKKQAFAQNGNLVKSKPILVDLTRVESGKESRNNGTSSRNREKGVAGPCLRGDQASQIEFAENYSRNEVEDSEVDAFWNFQASQSFSQSFPNIQKLRTSAR